jgi:hypothetical protein
MAADSAAGEKRRWWEAHVRAWERSGLRQSEYCRRQKLDRSVFGYWKQKGSRERSAERESAAAAALPARLVAVGTVEAEGEQAPRLGWAQASPLSVVVRGRYCVEVSEGFSSATLTQLIQTLERL